MKERPILFSAAMVRAILENRKTQTRRIVKPQPTETAGMNCRRLTFCTKSGRESLNESIDPVCEPALFRGLCPHGDIGDRMWVRETWAAHVGWDKLKPSDLAHDAKANFWFAADPEGTDGTADIPSFRRGKWRSSIFMPRWASRITLEITDVRVQRLQEISEKDAAAEGSKRICDICWQSDSKESHWVCEADYQPDVSRRSGFRAIWEDINGHESWNASPWVWAITFKHLESAQCAA